MVKDHKDLSQYFTKKSYWVNDTVRDIMSKYSIRKVIDPFAGGQDLLDQVKDHFDVETVGLDIDTTVHPDNIYSDSLTKIDIDMEDDEAIVTNPPYMAKNSAKNKNEMFYGYVNDTHYNDIYELAIDKCLEISNIVIAIIPETFIRTILKKEYVDHIVSVDIIEDNMFEQTECPVCVVCIDTNVDNKGDIQCMVGGEYVMDYCDIVNITPTPDNSQKISFNDPQGNLALCAIDSSNDINRIRFCEPEDLDYDRSKIIISSRAISFITVECGIDIRCLINKCNELIEKYRENTKDILLAPFKGNTKSGKRRRRLDFKTARAFIEQGIVACIEDADDPWGNFAPKLEKK